jgi:orotidine-5'-phosphate decarboxylase
MLQPLFIVFHRLLISGSMNIRLLTVWRWPWYFSEYGRFRLTCRSTPTTLPIVSQKRGKRTKGIMIFIDAIESAWKKKNTLLCVGLDPDLNKIPASLRVLDNPLFQFNKAIVDATADLVCAFKPQIAYYSAVASERDLELTIQYIHEHYAAVPVILDAKRGDIGSTAEKYAQEAFERYGADAVTVNPYMGSDTLEPFLSRKEKGVVILCRTSNPGAQDIQDITSDGKKVYQVIAEKAADSWNYNGNVLLVIGATFPNELKEVRSIVGDMPFLVPGVGSQGGQVKAAVANGKTAGGTGMVISSSRSIIYARHEADFAAAARKSAATLRDEINQYR